MAKKNTKATGVALPKDAEEIAPEEVWTEPVELTGDPGDAGGDLEPRHPLDIDPKLRAGGVGGAAGLVILWLLETYANVSPPELVQGAILLIIAFIFGYFKKNAASA